MVVRMKTIILLLDSLNRHFLPTYGCEWVKTPNIDRLAERSTIFDNHYVGSAPCMPARHDIMTGRLNFLECCWGPIQPYDCTLNAMLRKNGIFSHMVTDHYHYFHLGGENYHSAFDSWEFIRGQETDQWQSVLKNPVSREHFGQDAPQYRLNRKKFIDEEHYPSPCTLKNAADWVAEHADDDNWMLFVDSFDPHEPFDFPDEDLNEYPDDYDGKLFYWPKYESSDQADDEAIRHIRRRYATLITMSDRWIGKILDVLDRHQLWNDTMVILTTDHGHMLGEKGWMAKNYMPSYNEIFKIPLMIAYPGIEKSSRCSALTQNIDLMPTLLDFYGIDPSTCRNKLHGQSLIPYITGTKSSEREYVIYGTFGRQVNICDGRYTYFRSAIREDNTPLYIYTAVPTTIWQFWDADHITDFSKVEMGAFLPYTDYPVYRIPNTVTRFDNSSQDFKIRYDVIRENMLFDLQLDPDQEHPIHDETLEKEMCRKLAEAMKMYDSPEEQFTRLGLE